ncbi:dihydrofolate reductase family protein [Pseudonocardia sp. KRD291]|uniref:dihydrofolate reductase family protein n=1 Tax=Pseudonocardia sp. KRD291 TaxID=2792007 RepID=UPI001C4A6200|nr:dihydrofolate reductase family protein [Pseudonocardia sp. KRD291]MBW0103644.1 dihydrofolate reductase family protein [Pseudonocardia sp. KRD291]
MGTIKAHEFTTLDGVIGAPTWTFDYGFTDEMGDSIGRLTSGSEAIIFGRTTWEESGPAWSSRDMADDPGAPFFNETPKYVVSGTRTDAEGWSNSHLLGAYDVETIRTFKNGIDGGIYTYGSGTLVRALLADGLLDELHLYVFPVALGEGPRMFPEGAPRTALTLAQSESFGNGVVHLAYTPAGF